jgi:hypothetical protein
MAPAEQETTRTARLPRAEPDRPPRPAWPYVVVAVVAALVIALIGLLVVRNDSPRVRSEAVGRAVTTTAPSTTTTAAGEPGGETTATSAPSAPGSPATSAPSQPGQPSQPSQPSRQAYETARLSLDGLGPVDIGMTPAEASAAAGVSIRVLPEMDLGRGCAYARADRGPEDRLFMVLDGRIVRIDIGRPGVTRSTTTVSGIGVGSTEDEVKREYPGRITVQPHPYVPAGHYLVYTPVERSYQHLRLLFETDGRVVTTFRAGLADPVSWIEGCA